MPVLALVLLLQAPANVAGTWELTFTDPLNQTYDVELTIEQDGETLTGQTVDEATEPLTGRVRGDRIMFAYHVEAPGRGRMRLAFDGRVNGGAMAGSVAFGRIASGTWSAVRE